MLNMQYKVYTRLFQICTWVVELIIGVYDIGNYTANEQPELEAPCAVDYSKTNKRRVCNYHLL